MDELSNLILRYARGEEDVEQKRNALIGLVEEAMEQHELKVANERPLSHNYGDPRHSAYCG